MEYYSTLKKKEILTHATTRMKLESIMLSKPFIKRQNCMIPLTGATWSNQIHRHGKYNGGYHGLGKRGKGVVI